MGLWVRTPRISAERLTVLIGKGEVALCRGRGYERLDRAGQIGQGFGNGNQLAALTLHPIRPVQALEPFNGLFLGPEHLRHLHDGDALSVVFPWSHDLSSPSLSGPMRVALVLIDPCGLPREVT